MVLTVILLGYLGAKPPEGIYLILSRLATAYYFIHFLVLLPLLGRYEKTDPLPVSISEPVLTGGFSGAIAKTDKIINEQK